MAIYILLYSCIITTLIYFITAKQPKHKKRDESSDPESGYDGTYVTMLVDPLKLHMFS